MAAVIGDRPLGTAAARRWGAVIAKYRKIIVGTDGSESSLRAVDRAAELAVESDADLIVATAYVAEEGPRGHEPDQPKGENYRTQGRAPVYDMLREAGDRAKSKGARVEVQAVEGAPVRALAQLATKVGADLVVVGNVGVKSIAGRLFGSVPRDLKRRAGVEVLVVETES